MFCSRTSKIASDRFVAIPGKVITDKPIVIQKEDLNSHSPQRRPLATQHSFMGSSLQWLALIWAQGCSTYSGLTGSTGARTFPVIPGPATPFQQVFNHQFKPRPNSSPTLHSFIAWTEVGYIWRWAYTLHWQYMQSMVPLQNAQKSINQFIYVCRLCSCCRITEVVGFIQ